MRVHGFLWAPPSFSGEQRALGKFSKIMMGQKFVGGRLESRIQGGDVFNLERRIFDSQSR